MTTLPPPSSQYALPADWFPVSWQAVLWRNWGLVPVDRLARALYTGETKLCQAAAMLGLDSRQTADPVWTGRGYLTIIRQNWHLCTFDQLLILLDLKEEALAFILKEDDFFWHKMGQFKPKVDPPRFCELSEDQVRKTIQLANWLRQDLSDIPILPDNAFAFTRLFTRAIEAAERCQIKNQVSPSDSLCTIYSYFALYGDPLLDIRCDPFPEALLAEYAKVGVKGVWLQGILYQLVKYPFAPDLSHGHETRISNLNQLIERAGQYGISVYLYLNEPRAMDDAFYVSHPHLRGSREGDYWALCTSVPETRIWLEEAMHALFSRAPGLAGFITITMSENLTNCYSRPADICPRCVRRQPWHVVAEVNNLLARGAHAASPEARAIVWDWGWPDTWREKVVPLLSEGQLVQCTSETGLPTYAGGVSSEVIDYSLSRPGPGLSAQKLWRKARAYDLDIGAKVQLNNSWELSAVPWLPVFSIIAGHVQNLQKAGVKNLQLSWTLGGYPSPNLKLVSFLMAGSGSTSDFLRSWLGDELGVVADQAQQCFCKAFSEFPFHIQTLYLGPQNYGPMVPFQINKTGWAATMLGFPYDDLDGWRAIYPRQVFANQFAMLVKGWQAGLDILRPYQGRLAEFDEMTNLAAAALCHFRSSWNQIRWVIQRDCWLETQMDHERQALQQLIIDEREGVRTLIKLRQADSRIGYESSNHYYYSVQDLSEKLINLRWCEQQLLYMI